MVCSSCGKDVKEGASFCPNCGAAFGAEKKSDYKIDLTKSAPQNNYVEEEIEWDDTPTKPSQPIVETKIVDTTQKNVQQPVPQGAKQQGQPQVDSQKGSDSSTAQPVDTTPMGVDEEGNLVELVVSRNIFANFLKAIFVRYFKFNGRASRYEFWSFTISWWILFIGVGPFMSDNILKGYLVLTLFPALSMCARRLHDAGYTGWLMLIPGVGQIMAGFIGSQHGTNRWGHMRSRKQ